jgi:hypothetical protein
MSLVVLSAWRVHHGMPMESAITAGLLRSVFYCAAAIISWRAWKSRKVPSLGRFPWRWWLTAQALAIGYIISLALVGRSAAYLGLVAIVGLGGGNLLALACYKDTLRRRRARSEKQSAQSSREERLRSK